MIARGRMISRETAGDQTRIFGSTLLQGPGSLTHSLPMAYEHQVAQGAQQGRRGTKAALTFCFLAEGCGG